MLSNVIHFTKMEGFKDYPTIQELAIQFQAEEGFDALDDVSIFEIIKGRLAQRKMALVREGSLYSIHFDVSKPAFLKDLTKDQLMRECANLGV